MKVLIINTLYHPYKIGGAEVSVRLLAEGLVKIGDEVMVLSLNNLSKETDEFVSGVHCISFPFPNVYWPFSRQRKAKIKKLVWHVIDQFNIKTYLLIKEKLKEFKPDIVHTNNLAGWSISVWLAVKMSGCKLVHTTRDYYLLHPNSSLFKNGVNMDPESAEVRFLSFFKKRCSRLVDGYIGISKYIREIHIDSGFFPFAETKVIYNPVTLPPEIGLKECPSFKKVKTIGFIGRLSEEKGFDIFCELAKKYSTLYKFVAAGNFVNDKDLEKFNIEYKEYASLLGIINLEDFLNQVDAVVLPVKWREPFGRVVVECAKAGKIVLSSPSGGITELNDFFPNIYLSQDWLNDFDNFIKEESISVKTTTNFDFEPWSIAKEYHDFYLTVKSKN